MMHDTQGFVSDFSWDENKCSVCDLTTLRCIIALAMAFQDGQVDV